MTVRASYGFGDAWLGKEFGLNLASKYFDKAIIDALPRNVKGKYAGQHKASIRWVKVERGGWVKDAPGEGNGHVENRVGKIIGMELIIKPFRGETEVIASYGECHMLRD